MTTESDGQVPAASGFDGPKPEAETHDREPGGTRGDDKPTGKGPLERPVLLISAGVFFVVAALAGLLWWLHARHFESTDDAFVDTHIVHLAPQTAGRVTAVLVDDNQLVQTGEPVILIDSSDAQTRVAQARAQLAEAQAQVANARSQVQVNEATYRQSQADVAVAEAQATIAALDLARFERLAALNPAAVAEQQLDQAHTMAKQTSAQRDAALRASQMRAAQVVASRSLVVSGEQQVEAARAQLDEADINLSYTRIDAPAVGHVAQKSVAVGDYLQPGTQILAIVPLQMWVTANFKETQLERMRTGQPVTIRVDACPTARIRGHVDSIQRGAGQAFAILPPENATGNFVKVVQRVPVKITLDDVPSDCLLGPGMSVEPQVKVR